MNSSIDFANTSPVVLLGSGFSRAISSKMPTLATLGTQVLDTLKVDSKTLDPFAGNIEQWLSVIGADQPWQDEITNIENRSLFLRATQAIEEVISAAEKETLTTKAPEWLDRLMAHWSATSTTVITFNYDLLVERLLQNMRLTQNVIDLYRGPLATRGIPSGFTSGYSAPVGPIPAILKLHGSVNWAYNPNLADAPITLTSQSASWMTEYPHPNQPPRFIGIYDDLSPLIVPPSSSKSSFYSSAGLRIQWKQAAKALETATSLTVIGYSFPDTDFTTRQFAMQLPDGVPVTCVDYSEIIPDKIHNIFKSNPRKQSYVGQNALSDYISETTGSIVRGAIVQREHGLGATVSIDGVISSEVKTVNREDAVDALHSQLTACLGFDTSQHTGSFQCINGTPYWSGEYLAYVNRDIINILDLVD